MNNHKSKFYYAFKMNDSFHVPARNFLLSLCIIFISACGGSNSSEDKAKETAKTTPQAVAEVIGLAPQNSVYEVRSGSEVLLSGQNSKAFNKPLLNFSWEQTDSTGYAVGLYERSSNSVAFTAPQIPLSQTQGVTLEFNLTVYDADGGKNSAPIKVHVKPIKDANQFLTVTGQSNQFVVYVTGAVNDVIASDIPVTLNVTSQATWTGRDGVQHSALMDTQTLTGTVPAGTVTAINSMKNLNFNLTLPQLNADKINLQFKGADRRGRLEFEGVANAQMSMSFQLVQSGGNPLSVYVANTAGDALLDVATMSNKPHMIAPGLQKPIISGTANSATVDVELLRESLGIESKLSANNYYQCLDPANASKTFETWAAHAGFTGSGDGDVNTKYINNYDLGFGRDMHVREDASGNIYSYVTNYPTLENTINKRNDFAIVAMEYSPAPAGNCGDVAQANLSTSKKIVKFFAFVPDAVKGGHVRAESMNFDNRGEKFLPGVCTGCHSGNTNITKFNTTATIAASNADLESGFLPWDLDAFLYTQAADAKLIDPTFAAYVKANGGNDDVLKAYSRETQENLFKQQNQMILHTYTENQDNIPRFAQVIKQMHGWYGAQSNIDAVEAMDFGTPSLPPSAMNLANMKTALRQLPSGNFNSNTYVPKGWRGDASQIALYKDVFMRNCRMCHLATLNQKYDFDNYTELVTDTKLRNLIFEKGGMPLSRLTMDRLWVNFYGQQSAAEKLRVHLDSDSTGTNDVPLNAVPGMPVAVIVPDANDKAVADVILDVGQSQVFDGINSLFSTAFNWSLNSNSVSQKQKYTFTATTPGASDIVSLKVTGADGVSENKIRTVFTNNYTPVIANLPSLSMFEGETKTFDLFAALCPGAATDSLNCRSVYGDIKTGKYPTINISATTHGQITVQSVDTTHGIIQYQSTQATAAGNLSFNLSITDSYGENSNSVTVPVTVNSYPAPTITSDVCTVFALSSNNTNCADPSLNDIAATGFNLHITAIDSTSANGGSVSYASGVLHYTPPAYFAGTDTFNYTVADNTLSQKTATGTVTVNVIPNTVYANIQSFVPSPLMTVNEGRSASVNLFSTLCPSGTPDSIGCRGVFGIINSGAVPTITVVGSPVNGTVSITNATTGAIQFTSTAAKASGNGQFTFRLTDSVGEKSTDAIANITVNQFAAPVANNDSCSLPAINSGNASGFPKKFDGTDCANILANDTVALSLTLQVSSVNATSLHGGTVTLSSGTIRYTPPRFYVGTDSFQYIVRDNSLSQRTATATVNITVNATQTYTDLKNTIFSAVCSVCHFNGGEPNWQTYSVIIPELADTVGLNGSVLNLNQNTPQSSLLNTMLFIHPCDGGHTGGLLLCDVDHAGNPPTQAQLNADGLKVLHWVEEGATNN